MTEYEYEPKVFLVPDSLSELLEPESREPLNVDRVDPRAIVESGLAGSAVGAALEALAQAGLIIGRDQRDKNESDLDSAALESAAPIPSERSEEDSTVLILKANASMRRALAASALKQGESIYDDKFIQQRESKNRETLGRQVTERNFDAINDLYDDTEKFDDHPVIKAIELARNATKSEFEKEIINHADVIVRIIFRGDIGEIAQNNVETKNINDSIELGINSGAA